MSIAAYSVSPVRFRVSPRPSMAIRSSKAEGSQIKPPEPVQTTPGSLSSAPKASPPTPVMPVTESQMDAPQKDSVPISGCKTCGKKELERGCNGEGRIQGGIATVPGFGWWPIKAYRPCPGFVESGGRYKRRGQSMDEVAFGRGEKETS